MCAPGLPNACATSTPHNTASAQPVVTTIQPESVANDLRKFTAALAPVPSSTRTSVPINSPIHTECIRSPWDCVPPAGLGESGEHNPCIVLRNQSILGCPAYNRQVHSSVHSSVLVQRSSLPSCRVALQ